MNETINKDIFYRPSLEIDKNYYSSAEPQNISTEQYHQQEKAYTELTSVEEIDKKSDEVIEILLRARKALPVIPERIRNTLKEIIDKTIIHTALEQDELAKIIESDKKEEEKFNKYVEDLTNSKTKTSKKQNDRRYRGARFRFKRRGFYRSSLRFIDKSNEQKLLQESKRPQ